MSAYRKPPNLIPLSLYSPYQTFAVNRRLISRDKNRIFSKFYGDPELNRQVSQPLMNTCVRSFMWMYRSPVSRTTTFHEEQSLGKPRKGKLIPISKSNQTEANTDSTRVITHKPTVSLHKSQNLVNTGVLTEITANGSLVFTSATVIKGETCIHVPLNSLREVIFAPEGEIIYNLSQCLGKSQWLQGSNLYSNFSEITENYEYPYYLPSLETSVFIVKQKAIFARRLGKIIAACESKGMVMRFSKLIQYGEVGAIMAWEGCEAIAVCKGIARAINEDFFEFLEEERVNDYLTGEDLKNIRFSVVPGFTCRVNGEFIKFIYPSVTDTVTREVSAVPLGLLKSLIEAEFLNWSEMWVKRKEFKFPQRRAGLETSTLKVNISISDSPCVITLNSYKIQISNEEFEASFAFKITDMQFIYHNSGPDLIRNLMKTARLEEKKVNGKKIWDLAIDLQEMPRSVGPVSKITRVIMGGKEFKCKLITPWAELYKPYTGDTILHELSPLDISSMLDSNFHNWQVPLTRYFT